MPHMASVAAANATANATLRIGTSHTTNHSISAWESPNTQQAMHLAVICKLSTPNTQQATTYDHNLLSIHIHYWTLKAAKAVVVTPNHKQSVSIQALLDNKVTVIQTHKASIYMVVMPAYTYRHAEADTVKNFVRHHLKYTTLLREALSPHVSFDSMSLRLSFVTSSFFIIIHRTWPCCIDCSLTAAARSTWLPQTNECRQTNVTILCTTYMYKNKTQAWMCSILIITKHSNNRTWAGITAACVITHTVIAMCSAAWSCKHTELYWQWYMLPKPRVQDWA